MNGRALLALNVRKLRNARGLSQEELAADAGVDRAYLGGLERREGNPTIDSIDKLARALGVPIGALMAEHEQPGPEAVRAERRGDE